MFMCATETNMSRVPKSGENAFPVQNPFVEIAEGRPEKGGGKGRSRRFLLFSSF